MPRPRTATQPTKLAPISNVGSRGPFRVRGPFPKVGFPDGVWELQEKRQNDPRGNTGGWLPLLSRPNKDDALALMFSTAPNTLRVFKKESKPLAGPFKSAKAPPKPALSTDPGAGRNIFRKRGL